ncbi:MAG: T9SS type A sorting domain-containing protein, partial [bacterium]
IGNPFAFPVDWNNITASGNAQSPVFFDGTEYQFNITLLQPWEGYFVNNLESFPVTLSVSPVEAQAAVGAFAYKMDINEENEYLIQIAGNVPGTKLKDTQNFIGLLENVTKGRDELDFLEPPPIGEYVCLSFIEGEERFAGNFKPFNGKGQEWDLEITSTLPNKQVQITLLESGQLPEDFQLYILDKDFYSLIPINNNSFTVQLDKEFPKRRLKIILGTKDYAEHNEDGIPLIPLQFSLEQNYPNPFNPETTIRYQISKRSRVILEIYNVLGQKVRTLINNEQNPSAYSVQWDGLDDAGHLVSSGVYIYHLNAGEFTASRKLALIR